MWILVHRMDPVSISGRQGQSTTRSSSSQQNGGDGWQGYQWNIPLDEVFDCDSAPKCCRECYYKNKGMSTAKKVAISIFFFAASIAVVGVVVWVSLGPNELVIGSGNQRPVVSGETNFSPLMCSSYTLTNVDMIRNPVSTDHSSASTTPSSPVTRPSSSSPSSSSSSSFHLLPQNESPDMEPRFNATLLSNQPYRSYNTITYEKIEPLWFPNADYFNYWAMYLGSGSEVNVAVCPPRGTEVVLRIIEGTSDLDRILRNRRVEGEIFYTFRVPCVSSLPTDSYRFIVNSESDVYSFVFTITQTTNVSTIVSFTTSIKELMYDSWAVLYSCRNVSRCSIPMSSQASSLMLGMSKTSAVWPITIRAECVPAIGMYFAFFLGVPVGFILFLVTCGGVLYLCQMSVMRDVERADRRRAEALRHSAASSRHGSSSSRLRSTNARRTFRTRLHTAPLVDHDLLSSMSDACRQQDLPPMYEDVSHMSSPVCDIPDPPSYQSAPSRREGLPPSYDSIVT